MYGHRKDSCSSETSQSTIAPVTIEGSNAEGNQTLNANQHNRKEEIEINS